MTRARLALTALLTAAATVCPAVAQQPARQPRDVRLAASPVSGTAVISGRVTAADTGLPLRRALVQATSAIGHPREVLTDDEGRFQLPDLEPGAWQLTVSRAGYIPRESGQSRPFGRSTPVQAGPGQHVQIDMPLTRASAIVGRLYDDYGEAVAAARVVALRPRMARNQRYLEPIGEADFTDDTGAFRIHSLPPGEYYVTASARLAPLDSVVQTTFSPTFYPGTGDFAAAQRVRLAQGADAFIDFPLLPVRTARVSGVVVTSGGSRGDAFLSLTSEAGELGRPLGAGAITREDGSFAMADIPPGTYTLVAELRSGGEIVEVGSTRVTVEGSDVSGVTVTTGRPGTVRGTIVADAGVTRPLPASLEIVTRPRRTGAVGTFATASGSSFEMQAPAGPFTVDVEAPDGWMVQSVTLAGVDAGDFAIDIGHEQDVPVTIVLTDRLTQVVGTVSGAGGDGATVVVFPSDSGLWTPRRVRRARTDARGRFRIAGLPAGERYLAVAVADLEEEQEGDPEFLRLVAPRGTAFDLAAEGSLALDLKVLQ